MASGEFALQSYLGHLFEELIIGDEVIPASEC